MFGSRPWWRSVCAIWRRPAPGGRQRRHPGRRPVRRQQEEGQGEDGEPQRRQGGDGADMLRRRLVEPEQRGRRHHQPEQRDHQAQQAAQIADAPGPAGPAADTPGRDEVGQHRVVEDGRDLEGDGGHDRQHEAQHHVGRVGPHEPKGAAGCDADDREPQDTGLAPSRPVGHGAVGRAPDAVAEPPAPSHGPGSRAPDVAGDAALQ
jgi:hypothetical protein